MDLKTFKNESWALYRTGAEAEQFVPLIEAYFADKAIPTVTAKPPFVARVRPNYNGEVFKHIENLSYNPDPSSIKLQRANFNNQQVFYVSPHTDGGVGQCHNTAILETAFDSIKTTDFNRMYITVSRWIVQRPLNVVNLPYAANSIAKNKDFAKAKEQYDRILSGLRSLYGETESQRHIEALEFISELFAATKEKPYAYRVTAAYCDHVRRVLSANEYPLDGILYPSANTEAAGVNMALNTSLVDEGILHMDHAVMFAIQRHPTDRKHITFSDASTAAMIHDDGSIAFERIW